jgi:hypothetical protein
MESESESERGSVDNEVPFGRETKRSASVPSASAVSVALPASVSVVSASVVMTRERSESDDWRELLCALLPSSSSSESAWEAIATGAAREGEGGESLPDLSDDWKGLGLDLWSCGLKDGEEEEEEEFETTHEDLDDQEQDQNQDEDQLHCDCWTDI